MCMRTGLRTLNLHCDLRLLVSVMMLGVQYKYAQHFYSWRVYQRG